MSARATLAGTALAALLALAAPARAQLQRDLLEPEKEKKREPRVTFDLGGEESYESNVPYTQLLGQDDFVTRGTGRLAAVLPIRRGQVELGAEGGVNVYRTVKGLDRYTWGFLGAVEHKISRRAEFKIDARSSHGYSRDNPRVEANGALSPLTLVRTDVAEAGYRQRLFRTLDLKLEGRGELFRFDNPELQDGWTVFGRGGFENAFSAAFALGAEAGYGRTATRDSEGYVPGVAPPPGALYTPRPGTTIEVGTAVATLRWRPTRHVVLRVEGGAARYGPVGQPLMGAAGSTSGGSAAPTPATVAGVPVPVTPSTTPTVAANLTCSVGPHTLTALASRRIEQTYGVGAIGINRALGLEYRLALARWATFLLQGADNHNEAPDSLLLSQGRTVTAGFDCALPADFTARLTYSYWDRQDPERDWRSHTVALGLSKRFTWR